MHEVDQDVVVMYTLVTIFLFKIIFQKFLTFLVVYYVHEGSEGVGVSWGFWGFRVFTFEGVCRVYTWGCM